jgi:hypothetical protein
MEARIRGKDGLYRWALIRMRPVRDEKGIITRWYGVGTDIEDRKQAQYELQQLVDAVPNTSLFLMAMAGVSTRIKLRWITTALHLGSIHSSRSPRVLPC